jgi:hypothetical protein
MIDLRQIRLNTRAAAAFLIAAACVASFVTGWLAPEPMIGDEVTHYYMLEGQAADLTQPNFWVRIPVGYADDIVRLYAHSFGWHYLGALVSRAAGAAPYAIQFYHTLFWLQLLAACYLLAQSRKGATSGTSLLYLLVMATLPAGILFSVAFYQDIPLTAQIVSAWLMLATGHWFSRRAFYGVCALHQGQCFCLLSCFSPAAFLVLMAQYRQDGRMAAGWVAAACCRRRSELCCGSSFVCGNFCRNALDAAEIRTGGFLSVYCCKADC